MNPENDIPKYENCSRIIREFLKDYSRSPTRIRYKYFCIPKRVYWNPIIRLSNCKIVQRTRKSKMKHTTPTTVLFFNLTGFPITISVTSIATNVNGCGIGIMGNTLTMDVDKTENKIQTVHVYPYAFKNVYTRDYFSSDNSMTNSKTERENIYELLKYQNDIFWKDDKDLEYHKYNNKIIWNPLFHHLITYRLKKIKNTVHRRQEKIFNEAVNIENAEKIKVVENMKKKDDNISGILELKMRNFTPLAGDEQQNDGAPTHDRLGLNEDEKLKATKIGKDIHDMSREEIRIMIENEQISGRIGESEELSQYEKYKAMQIGMDIRDRTVEEVRLHLENEQISGRLGESEESSPQPSTSHLSHINQRVYGISKDEILERFWDDKKLKIGAINRNLRLSSAMIDPCSHRYYLSIKIHDTDEDKGRLIMTDNIHRTNYDIIIREDDVKKPDFK